MVLLCTAVALWICGFDAMYGAQDEEFDKSQGLHSLAVSYGAPNAFKLASAMHVICIACFFTVGIMLSLGQIYFIGVGIAAGTLVYQHRIVSPTDFSQVTQAYFMRNGIVSVAIFICTWLSFFL
jgi:4-hydroxybenzoate polyprenyltransferase